MKRWLWWFFLTIGIVMLLSISHRPVQSPVHPLDRSVLTQREFASTTASPGLSRSRVDPWQFFAIEFGLSTDIADEHGPPWLGYRGPPGSHACSHDSDYPLQGCRSGWQPKGEFFPAKFRPPEGKFKTWGFSTPFS
jgi:hypothetical protein